MSQEFLARNTCRNAWETLAGYGREAKWRYCRERMGEMIGTTAGRSRVNWVARFAFAAGATGILANLFLVAFFALQASHPEDGTSLGAANDLVGSLAVAFMIPVALSGWLPDRRFGRIVRMLGLAAMAVLVAGGPVLVLGVLTDDSVSVLYQQMVAIVGCLPSPGGPARGIPGAEMLAGGAVVGLGLLLPWMSVPQLILFGSGGVLAAITMFGIPFWFLLLGRHLGES